MSVCIVAMTYSAMVVLPGRDRWLPWQPTAHLDGQRILAPDVLAEAATTGAPLSFPTGGVHA